MNSFIKWLISAVVIGLSILIFQLWGILLGIIIDAIFLSFIDDDINGKYE